jgi:hypothetical protein
LSKGVGDNKGEKQLLIIDGEGEFDQDVLAFINNFRTKHELIEAYNGTFGVMDSIKNVTIPTKGDRYLRHNIT